ncbi:MAG: PAS domain S-box protein [Oscillochloris sp.]|nr:PAS domain S-box protein [Oscillochloris sp.]
MEARSADSALLFQAVIDGAPSAIVVVDLAGHVMIWNQEAERLFGWTAQECIGNVPPNIPPGQELAFAELLHQGAQNSTSTNVERLRKDGTRLQLRLATAPLRNADGRIIGVIGMHNDITLELQVAADLNRQQQLLKTIVDHIPVMIAFFGLDSRFEFVNREWERILGWDIEMMNRHPDIMSVFYPEPEYRQAALEYMLAAKPGWREFRTVARNGEQIYAAWANVRFADGSGIGFGQDLTALKHQTDELEQQVALMHLLLESIPFGYIYLEAPTGRVLHYNQQAERLLGHPIINASETDPTNGYGAYHLDGRPYTPEDYPAFQVLQHAAPVLDLETRYLRGDDRWITLRNSSIPVRNSAGAMIGVINLFEDISERTALEARLQQAQKMESIGRLAGGIAHDFNNLLVPIIGYIELSMIDLDPENKLYSDLQQVRRAAEQATDLTRQILAFSRQQMLEMRTFDLNSIVRDFEKMIRRLIGEDVALRTSFDHESAPILADKGQIEQVLLNLVVNSRDAMPSGGTLTIATANVYLDQAYVTMYAEGIEAGHYMMLAVSDTGQGMDAATRKLIFEPFFTTKARGKGTGLGLSTVFGIIKQHKGHISVYSEPNRGTTFKIYLPQSGDTPHLSGASPAESAALYGSETILVVEDEPMVCQLICETLRTYGYRLIEAQGAGEGLRQAVGWTEPIHLLLTDVVMPEMDGMALYHHLLTMQPQLRVLYMSGYTNDVIVNHGILNPGVAFLPKPFAIRDLAQKVRQVLDRPANSSTQH